MQCRIIPRLSLEDSLDRVFAGGSATLARRDVPPNRMAITVAVVAASDYLRYRSTALHVISSNYDTRPARAAASTYVKALPD